MLPLAHELRGRGPNDQKVHESGNEDCGDGRKDRPSIDIRENATEPRSCAEGCLRARVCKSENDRKCCLQAEIDWKDSLLERRKLGTRKNLEGNDAAYKGLQ